MCNCDICEQFAMLYGLATAEAYGTPTGHKARKLALNISRARYQHLIDAHGYPEPAVDSCDGQVRVIQTVKGLRRTRVNQAVTA